MNNKFSKITSLVLTLTILLSLFSVYSFATSGARSAEDTVVCVLNRSFDDGWDFSNGMSSGDFKNDGTFSVDFEEDKNFDSNYFGRIEVKDDTNVSQYRTLDHAVITSGGTVLEYDIKSDCHSNSGQMYFLTPGDTSTRTKVTVFSISGNNYRIHNDDNDGSVVTVGKLDKWLHIANVYNFDQDIVFCAACNTRYDLGTSSKCTNSSCGGTSYHHCITSETYFSYADSFDWENAITATSTSGFDLNNTYVVKNYIKVNDKNSLASINVFRIGTIGVQKNSKGEGYCLDNIKFYYDATPADANGNAVPMTVRNDMTVEKFGYGEKVDASASPTVHIGGKNQMDIIDRGFLMKVGSDYMLVDGERAGIFVNSDTGKAYGAPVKVNGVVCIPFEQLIASTGYPSNIYDGTRYEISTKNGSTVIALGRDSAAINGEKVALTVAPFLATDPDDPNNNYPVIALSDVELLFPGYYVTYDEMGLILVADEPNVFNRESDLGTMVELMKEFIFDYTTSADMYNMIDANTNGFDHPYLVADDSQFEFLRNVYNAHKAMEAGLEYDEQYIDPTLYSMLIRSANQAGSVYERFTKLPEESAAVNSTYKEYAYKSKPTKYQKLAVELTNPFYGIMEGVKYTDSTSYKWDYLGAADENGEYWGKAGKHYNDGYDWAGSRNSVIVSYASYIQQLALGYQITLDESYAELAYDMMISICDNDNWHHWAHKHFLSTSEMLMRVGLAYDWLYDIWTQLQSKRSGEYSLSHITQSIYRKGIYYGYDVSRYSRTSDVWTRDHSTSVRDEEGYIHGIWNWSKTEINWNGVCSSGLVVAAMAIVGEDSKLPGLNYAADDKEGINRVMWTMTGNLWNLCRYGLTQYAPDGSYIEGAGYWSYSTNYIAMLMWAVNNAVGDDLGLYETWGMDKTFYFAVQSEYSIFKDNGSESYAEWAFHDNGGGMQDTKMFFFASDMLSDNGLAAIRLEHIRNGKGSDWTDILAYKPEFSDLTMDDAELDLDYRFEACEGAISRSSWEAGHTYAGIMGNANNCGNHGQMDSGNFTYVDDGYAWVPDIGSDEYNVYQYFGYGIRQFYYRNSAEGHNQIILTSRQDTLPFGQSYTGCGVITDFHSEDAGMYAILDNTTAYGKYAERADRGMLVTNSRETVVIQDEIVFTGIETAYWSAHTQASEIVISDDGRTAYMRQKVAGKDQFVRFTIVSNNAKLKFEVMTCALGAADKLLDGIHPSDYSMIHGGINERSRKSIKRLVIKLQDVVNIDMAVVIEDVYGFEDVSPVQYDFKPMDSWTVSESYTPDSSQGTVGGDSILDTNLSDLERYGVQASLILNTGYAFSSKFTEFFKYLSLANSAAINYSPDSFSDLPGVKAAYDAYLECLERYGAFYKAVNRENDTARAIATCIMGIGV